jgi:hypothetical protein
MSKKSTKSSIDSIIKSKSTQDRVMHMLLFLLEQKLPVSRAALEKKLGVNSRSIFRYLNIIEDDLKFPIIKTNGRYSIDRAVPEGQQLTFSADEIQSMYLAMMDFPDEQVQTQIRNKLLHIYSERKKADNLIDHQIIDRIKWFEKHVNESKIKFQIRLSNYTSLNGLNIRDRIVSPVYFNSINHELYAFDMEPKSDEGFVLKTFLLSRIGGEEKLKDRVPIALLNGGNQDLSRDKFGYLIKGQPLIPVVMDMDLMALKLFELHFPQLITLVESIGDSVQNPKFRIQIEIVRPDPLVGFCLGCLNHIKIQSPAFILALKEFYQKNIHQNLIELGISELSITGVREVNSN